MDSALKLSTFVLFIQCTKYLGRPKKFEVIISRNFFLTLERPARSYSRDLRKSTERKPDLQGFKRLESEHPHY